MNKKYIGEYKNMTDAFIEKITQMNNPSVVGLDPQEAFIPRFLLDAAVAECGEGKAGIAAAFFAFNKGIIDAVCDIVPAVKPQIAMYERLGAYGAECFAKTAAYAKSKGLIVIGDVKRGDIASTAEAYADAYLGENAAFECDFITLNPYLGADSLAPFIDKCTTLNKGIFVLVKTSNPGGADIQDLVLANTEADGGGHTPKTVYERVALMVSHLGEGSIGKSGFSRVAAVVGATYPKAAARLRALMPHTLFLVPGYGAQGGGAAGLRAYFTDGIKGAVVNSSRGIIASYKGKTDERNYAQAARQATLDMKKDILEAVL